MMSPPASKHSNTQLTLDQDDLTAQVARVLVEMQRQVTQKAQRTVEVPLVQYIDSRVEVQTTTESPQAFTTSGALPLRMLGLSFSSVASAAVSETRCP